LIGKVHRLLIFFNAKYISLKTASSFGNNEPFFATALREQWDSFLTNDDLFKSVGSAKIKILSDLTLT